MLVIYVFNLLKIYDFSGWIRKLAYKCTYYDISISCDIQNSISTRKKRNRTVLWTITSQSNTFNQRTHPLNKGISKI